MKQVFKLSLLAVGSTLAMGVAAQTASDVTLYGVIDAAIRNQTNENNAGQSKLQMPTGGGLSASRWGLRGSEDLGGGNKAIFTLESWLSTDTGATYTSSRFFEQSWVGIESKSFGRLTLGRQYNLMFDAVTRAHASNSWIPYAEQFKPEVAMMAGPRVNNMAKYYAVFGNVAVGLQYAAGEQSGDNARGQQSGFSGIYTAGNFRASTAYLETADDANTGKLKATSAGLSYRMGNVRLHGGYFLNKFDQSFSGAVTNLSFSGVALTLLGAQPGAIKEREMFMAGIEYKLSSKVTVSGNVWTTDQKGWSTSYNGEAVQYQSVVSYDLSKRTALYAAVDYGTYKGAMRGAAFKGINEINGTAGGIGNAAYKSQTGTMVGIRHSF